MPRIILLSFAAAVVVFCIVQDRVTAAGARRYVTQQREALEAGGTPIGIADVMEPAIRRSVEQGVLWGGVVFAAGVAAGGALTRRFQRE